MYRLGLADTLVTHANMKGLGLTSLFGDRRGFMLPQLNTKTCGLQDFKYQYVNRKAFGASFVYWVDFKQNSMLRIHSNWT